MIDVKVSSRGSGSALNLAQFVGNGDNEWQGCRFHVNEPCEKADVWFVIEDVDDDDTTCLVPDEAIIFLSAETSWPPGFFDTDEGNRAFLDQFTWIYTWQDVYRPNVTSTFPFLPWMINANHGAAVSLPHERDVNAMASMTDVPKTHDLSVICSTQSATPGHRQRLRFITALKDHFGDRLDWFGNGIQPIATKWEGLAPYRYSIAIENHMAMNVATEKLWDPLLAFAVPIYAGAPNAEDLLPRESFVRINLADINGSIATIEQLLAQDDYARRLESVRSARDEILGPLNVYSRIAELAQYWAGRGRSEDTQVLPRKSRPGARAEKSMTRKFGEFFNTIGDTLVQRSLR